MSPAERRALLMLLVLAIAGHAVRRFVNRPGDAPGDVQLLASLTPGDPKAHKDSALALARPLEAGEHIDADVASAAELARLPRVGLALAKTIVADRSANGPFGGIDGLDRVPGIGPGLLRTLAPFLSFSKPPGLHASLPGVAAGPAVAGRPLEGAPALAPVDLNAATAEQLDALPGVGPAKAAAVVAWRESHGRFGALADLRQVKGFGPAAMTRLEGLVVVR